MPNFNIKFAEQLKSEWNAADNAWNDALVAEYGSERATDMRYLSGGQATPRLKELYDNMCAARTLWRNYLTPKGMRD